MTPAQQSILTRLQSGPATMLELVLVTGSGQSSIAIELGRLTAHGHVVENVRWPGSHGGGLYRLRGSKRRCQQAGCITVLSHDNPGRYCRRHEAARQSELDPLDALITALAEDCGEDPWQDRLVEWEMHA